MEKSLEGKRAIVTGAGQGIGRGIALKLLQSKVDVIAISKNAANLESLKNEAGQSGGKLTTMVIDLSDWGATKSALEKLNGPIDFLVNNAGVTCVKPLLEIKSEDIDGVFNVNVKAVINVSQVAVKKMLESGKGGSIVNISSNASSIGLLEHTIYCASKSALDSVTRVMAAELGKHSIRVNSVNPTVVMTEMGKAAWGEASKAEPMLKRIPLGRFIEVKEVVDAVLYLLSDGSSGITGVCLPIDGGLLSS